MGKRRVFCVVLVVAAVGMFLSLRFSGYFYRLYRMNSYGGEALDNHTIYFCIESSGLGCIDLKELQKGRIIQNATLLAHAPSTGSEYCVLYTNGKKDIFDGEYFEGWDFVSGEAVCVVGINAAKIHDGEVAYLKSGKYPIHAIRKESFLESINNAVFYTDSLLDTVPSEEIFAVASQKKTEAEHSYERLKEYMGSVGVALKQITFNTVTFQNFLDYNSGFLLAMGGYALLLLVIHFLLFWYWEQCKRTWCKVMWLFGEQNPERRVILQFSGLLIAADLLGGMLYWMVTEKMYFWWRAVLAGMTAVFLVQILAVLCGSLWMFCRKKIL